MKKHVLFLLIWAFVITVSAQDFTIRLAGGYAGPGFQNNESVLGPKIDPSSPTTDALVPMAFQNDSAHTYKAVHGSYGTGGNVTLAAGYMINRYFGIDIGIGYAHSNNISCIDVRQLIPGAPEYLTANINSYSWALALAPSLVVTGAKTGWKVYPYARLGVVLPVAGKLIHNINIFAPVAAGNATTPGPVNNDAGGWLGRNTQVQLVTDATVSVGISGAIGVAYRPLPFMNVFAELNGQYLTVRAKSSKVTEWNADGMNDIPLRGAYRTQFNYVDQLTPTSNNAQTNSNYNRNAPKDDVRPTVPGSNLGFNVGVTFFLGKKTLAKKSGSETATGK